jgi:AcrR family transcriptional regulator
MAAMPRITMNVPPTSPRPRWERRKGARPSELLAAALDLFVEKGYAATRLDEIAARAGVSKGTLYLYFENKEELLQAVVRESIVTRITQARDDLIVHEGSCAEQLRELIERWWREYGSTKAGGIGKLIMAESGNFPETARLFAEEAIEPWHQVVRSVIERGIARGEFRPVDIAMFVEVIVAPLAMLSMWQNSFAPCGAQSIEPAAFVAATIDVALAALRPEAATAAARRGAR